MEKEVDVTILPGTLDTVFWVVSSVLVVLLLFWDVGTAWKRRAFWIPGHALVLSAVIIQLLSFIDYSHIRLYSGNRYQTKEVVAILVKNQLVIDSGRLMLCVLIAYLLPGMVRSGSITVGSNLAPLALSIIFHVVSELRSIWKMEKRNESLSALVASSEGFERIFFYLSSTILIVVIIYLLCLLIRAVMVGSRIRGIMSEKISSALLCCRTPRYRRSYDDIKVHVLKCWLVARLCQPDYVFVRTGLCSMAFIVVTVCIGVHVIKLTYLYFTDNESLNSVTKGKLVLFVIVGQCGIVLIGWIFLLFRYMTSRMHGNIFSEEYFETMSIEDALNDLPACLTRLFFGNKRNQEKTLRCLDKKFRNINTSCGNAWDRVKQFFQFFPMQNPSSPVTSTRGTPEFSMYQPTLERLLIPGESELSLWEANQLGFTKVKGYMEQEDGKCCASELLAEVTAEDEADREKAVRLQQANKNSWKKTAIQLINRMISSYKNSDASEHVIEKAMKGYIQAWEYMNFVDGLNEEVKSLGRQADREFESLQHSWDKRAQPEKEQVNDLEQPPPVKSASQSDQIHPLERELANVYFACMEGGLKEAVLEKCRKLAEEGMEEEILDVAILLAKAQGVLDKAREGRNTDQASSSSPIPTVNEQAGKGQGPAELPPIDLVQSSYAAVSKVGEGNDEATLTPRLGGLINTLRKLLTKIPAAGNNSRNANASGNTMNANASVAHNSVGGIGSVGDHSVGGYNNTKNNNIGLRLRNSNKFFIPGRSYDSLTDQTEVAVVEERKKEGKEKPMPGERSRKKRYRKKTL